MRQNCQAGNLVNSSRYTSPQSQDLPLDKSFGNYSINQNGGNIGYRLEVGSPHIGCRAEVKGYNTQPLYEAGKPLEFTETNPNLYYGGGKKKRKSKRKNKKKKKSKRKSKGKKKSKGRKRKSNNKRKMRGGGDIKGLPLINYEQQECQNCNMDMTQQRFDCKQPYWDIADKCL